MSDYERPTREPVFNIPGVVVALLAIFAAIQAIRDSLLSPQQDLWVILTFAFIPVRYAMPAGAEPLPGGLGADLWTFLTYGFLHGGWLHLIVNGVWMLAFGSAVARRFGTVRFLAFSALATIGGAALHLALHFGEPVPVVGASAAISGQMAAAARFVFEPGAPLGGWRRAAPDWAYRRPATSLAGVVRNRQAMSFLGIWFGLNILFGVFNLPLLGGGGDAGIAWEAHIGGFLVGLVLFPLFDPVGRQPESA